MKTALITGGARGIGLAIAKKLKTTYKVIIWDIIETTDFEFMKVDISNFEEVHQKAKEVGDIDKIGR